MYLLCQFSVIFHDSSWLSSSSYLNRLTLYPGKASQTCISHYWFPFLWGQFLSLLYRMHILFLKWQFLGIILMFTYLGSVFIPVFYLISSLFSCFTAFMFSIIEIIKQPLLKFTSTYYKVLLLYLHLYLKCSSPCMPQHLYIDLMVVHIIFLFIHVRNQTYLPLIADEGWGRNSSWFPYYQLTCF